MRARPRSTGRATTRSVSSAPRWAPRCKPSRSITLLWLCWRPRPLNRASGAAPPAVQPAMRCARLASIRRGSYDDDFVTPGSAAKAEAKPVLTARPARAPWKDHRAMSPSSGVPLYRNHDYVRLVLAQLLSIVGRETGAIVLPLLVLALTNSPAQVGWVAAVQSVPYLVLALPAGALVDRWSRKRTMFVCDALRLLALAYVPCDWWLGWVAIAQLYAVALVTGVAVVFYNIAELAGLPLLVPKEQLPQAMSGNTVVEWTGELSAPALGGVLVGLGATMIAGAMLAYGAQAAILALSLVALAGITNPLKVATGARAASSLWREMGEGLSWLLRHRVIRAFALLAMVQNILFSPVNIALIVLMWTAYRVTPQEIGLFFAAAGVSGLVGTFIAPFVTRRLAIGRLIVLPDSQNTERHTNQPFAHTLWRTAAGWM